MRTHAQIISDAGGYKDLADKLGLEREQCRFWERREGIPPEYWSMVAAGDVASLDELAEAAAARRGVPPTPQDQAAA